MVLNFLKIAPANPFTCASHSVLRMNKNKQTRINDKLNHLSRRERSRKRRRKKEQNSELETIKKMKIGKLEITSAARKKNVFSFTRCWIHQHFDHGQPHRMASFQIIYTMKKPYEIWSMVFFAAPRIYYYLFGSTKRKVFKFIHNTQRKIVINDDRNLKRENVNMCIHSRNWNRCVFIVFDIWERGNVSMCMRAYECVCVLECHNKIKIKQWNLEF